MGTQLSRSNTFGLNLKFWCGDWEEKLIENGDGILSRRKGAL
jgi:hypothetical protein